MLRSQREYLNKIMYHWYMMPKKLSKIYKGRSSQWGKCEKYGHFTMHGGLVKKLWNVGYKYIQLCKEF